MRACFEWTLILDKHTNGYILQPHITSQLHLQFVEIDESKDYSAFGALCLWQIEQALRCKGKKHFDVGCHWDAVWLQQNELQKQFTEKYTAKKRWQIWLYLGRLILW